MYYIFERFAASCLRVGHQSPRCCAEASAHAPAAFDLSAMTHGLLYFRCHYDGTQPFGPITNH
jgi:hypothetical protein